MKITSIASLVLMVAASGLAACTTSSAKSNESGPSTVAATTETDAVPDKVVVYYFHGARRCRTCVGIEEGIKKTITERFAKETASSELTFKEVNIDEPENKHFVEEFDISFSTMVVATNKGPKTLKWENCNKVWDHAHNPEALSEYTEKSVRTYLAMLKKS
jgi:hypothetical protein